MCVNGEDICSSQMERIINLKQLLTGYMHCRKDGNKEKERGGWVGGER